MGEKPGPRIETEYGARSERGITNYRFDLLRPEQEQPATIWSKRIYHSVIGGGFVAARGRILEVMSIDDLLIVVMETQDAVVANVLRLTDGAAEPLVTGAGLMARKVE